MARKPSLILGISSGHGDSSAALVVDGKLIAAAEEERFTRIKHYALFPKQSVAYCLEQASLQPKDVDTVAIARAPLASFWKKLTTTLKHPQVAGTGAPQSGQVSVKEALRRTSLGHARIHRVEHHLAHMMSVRYMTDQEPLALLSLDGMGDFVSTAIGRPKEAGIEILQRVHFPHSLGFFYTAMTQYLGFFHHGDEFKVMGLSSYGKPRYLPAMRQLIRERDGFGFELNLEAFPILKNPIRFSIEKSQPKIKPFYNVSFLTQVIGLPPRKITDPLTEAHWDLAKSVQARFEEIGNHLLGQLFDKVGGDCVGLAGGCAHNSVWVGKIPTATPFKKIFVAPASHDAGIAVGAAIAAAGRAVTVEGGHWGLLGPTLGASPVSELKSEGVREQTFSSDQSLIQWMVEELASGKILGLVQGRMEFGPRALGNRSILADPRLAEMRERLNERVKHREWFRPFAASVLWEHQSKWFKESFDCPNMEGVFDVLGSERNKIAGVVHADGTCRIQSVHRDTQSFYWELIEAFRKKTGIPMLINTSFNDSEPIVCSEADVLRCFQTTDLDALVLGRRVYSKLRTPISLAG